MFDREELCIVEPLIEENHKNRSKKLFWRLIVNEMSNGQKKSYIEYCRLQVTFMQVMANTIKTFSSFECNKQTTIKVNNLQDVFQAVVNTMINDRTRIWNSVETYKLVEDLNFHEEL